MPRRSSAVVLFLMLSLILTACGETVATQAILAQPTPTSTSTPLPPTATWTSVPPTPTTMPPTPTTMFPTRTATEPPRATATPQPISTPTATRPRPTARPTNTPEPTNTLAPVPAGVVAIPELGFGHVNEGQPLVIPHSPPSSGQHYPSALYGGIYRQEAKPGNWLHSLEHGYVVALVKCAADCDAIFDQLQRLYDTELPKSTFGNVKFVATTYSEPFTNGEAQLALVAWGYELLLPAYDADRILSFYKRFVDEGPELVP